MTVQTNAKRKFGGSSFGIDDLPRISHGIGSWVYDASGKRYLDGSGGPAVYALGHAHPEVNAAIKDQLDRIAHAYRYLFTSNPAEDLQTAIAEATEGLFNQMVFVNSGSEAVESCMKIALQYHSARGEKSRRRFIARRRSYHGNTLGALSLSGFESRRTAFEGSLLPVSFVSAANAYRLPQNVTNEGLVPYLAAELEREILTVGAENVAAFVFEPVVGAAGGVVPAPVGYARAMADVCRRHGVLVIADEVMCGSGRTGTWCAIEQHCITPDIMSVAKGLAAGYIPMGAALYSDEIHAVLTGDGGVQTGHTFTAHTAGCAAAVAVQTIIRRDGLLERVAFRGARLKDELRQALADIPEVGDVRGAGYFIGIEIVTDPETKQPFPAELKLHAEIGRRAFDAGLIVYPCAGNVDGKTGDTVIVAPPYNATDDELTYLTETLTAAIRGAVAAARA